MISRRGFLQRLLAGIVVCALPVDLGELQLQEQRRVYLEEINRILKEIYQPYVREMMGRQSAVLSWLQKG